MPRLIETPPPDAAIDLDALVDHCESSAFDPCDRESLAAAAPMLRALAANRHFLADMAVAELKTRCAGQRRDNPYSAQVLLLRPPRGKYVLRAAFWPSARDHVMRARGAAAFLYHVPHDHAFDFLTVGYLGPGYWSDHYEHDGTLLGLPGEKVALRPVESSALSEGRMLLYRAHRDIHVQRPPDRMSISLNILTSLPDQGWRRQYRFDLEKDCIAECMTISSAQMLLELAVETGMADGVDLARDFARHHPDDAMRLTAWRALTPDAPDAAAAHWEQGARNDSALVRAASIAALRLIGNGAG